jgi:hypothetical protein
MGEALAVKLAVTSLFSQHQIIHSEMRLSNCHLSSTIVPNYARLANLLNLPLTLSQQMRCGQLEKSIRM